MSEKLGKLVKLLIQSWDDGIEFPAATRLVGDWDNVSPGQKIIITFTEPYRVETGFLFTLPGLEADDIFKGGIVQIPSLRENDEEQQWFVFKHLAILADTIELETFL